MHLCDVQIHLTLTSMDQSGFMQSSHGVANLNGFPNELLIFKFFFTHVSYRENMPYLIPGRPLTGLGTVHLSNVEKCQVTNVLFSP